MAQQQTGRGKVHFIGVGGVGMSGIAHVAADKGFCVSGSDMKASRYTNQLRDAGVRVAIGQRAENLPDGTADDVTVVVSTAIMENNPELAEARRRGLPIIHRAQMLARLGVGLDTLAVAGTHGKTTTSSMLASTLDLMGLDPTFLIGGMVRQYGTNAHSGAGAYYVVEADESDKSFTYLSPAAIIVTNIEPDHLDHYADLDEIYEKFAQFIASVPEGAPVVVCAADARAVEIARQNATNVITYGFAAAEGSEGVEFSCSNDTRSEAEGVVATEENSGTPSYLLGGEGVSGAQTEGSEGAAPAAATAGEDGAQATGHHLAPAVPSASPQGQPDQAEVPAVAAASAAATAGEDGAQATGGSSRDLCSARVSQGEAWDSRREDMSREAELQAAASAPAVAPDARITAFATRGVGSTFTLTLPSGKTVTSAIKQNPGAHNVLNGAAVLTLIDALGLDATQAAGALAEFCGVHRRFDLVGEAAGVTVVDDYAHHPTEIAATVRAALALDFERVHVLFQPHRYSRVGLFTEVLHDEFGAAFDGASNVVFMDVYSAGETPVPGVTGQTFMNVVLESAGHPAAQFVPRRIEVPAAVCDLVRPGDLVLTMGAGDVTEMGALILDELTRRATAQGSEGVSGAQAEGSEGAAPNAPAATSRDCSSVRVSQREARDSRREVLSREAEVPTAATTQAEVPAAATPAGAQATGHHLAPAVPSAEPSEMTSAYQNFAERVCDPLHFASGIANAAKFTPQPQGQPDQAEVPAAATPAGAAGDGAAHSPAQTADGGVC